MKVSAFSDFVSIAGKYVGVDLGFDSSTFWRSPVSGRIGLRSGPVNLDREPAKFVYHVQTLFSFVEIFEFASRLAYSSAQARLSCM